VSCPYDRVLSIIHESGIWASAQHHFIPSGDVLRLTGQQAEEIQKIATASYRFLRDMAGVAARAHRGIPYGPGELLDAIFGAGLPRSHKSVCFLRPDEPGPFLFKIDLMMTPQGLRIAEIDGFNRRGAGYSTLAALVRAALYPDALSFPGVIPLMATRLRQRGIERFTLLYADKERFYLPEFTILARELAQQGVTMEVIGEKEFTPSDDRRVFLDFPLLDANHEAIAYLVKAYADDSVTFLNPPRPFWGSKNLLGLLWGSPLHVYGFIPSETGDCLRSFTPPTHILGAPRRTKRRRRTLGKSGPWQRRLAYDPNSYILKAAMSSGMKGVTFSHDPRFAAGIEKAESGRYTYVLQEAVEQSPQPLCYFDQGGQECKGDWYVRLTVHVVDGTAADIIVTARQDTAVHGATDSLQIGAIIAH